MQFINNVLTYDEKNTHLSSDVELENSLKSIIQTLEQSAKRKIGSLLEDDEKDNIIISKILTTSPLSYGTDFQLLNCVAEEIRNEFSSLVVIGMGGAILNPMSVLEFSSYCTSHSIKVQYNYYLDPFTLFELTKSLELDKTAFLVISKSGNTIETFTLFHYWLDQFMNLGIKEVGRHFYCITGNLNSNIGKLATKIGAKLLSHDPDIGGRFSAFTSVGILPGLIAGAEMMKFCQGGELILNDLIDNGINSLAAKGAITLANHYKNGFTCNVNISYIHKLSNFLLWQSQIIAESLGKQGMGITPVRGLGPLDQHSQMQLFLDGPNNKLYNIIYTDNIYSDLFNKLTDGFIKQNRFSVSPDALLDACFYATHDALVEQKRPVRLIKMKSLNMESFGALMMYTMLETILCGLIIGVNPYNQEIVELIKTKIDNRLSKS